MQNAEGWLEIGLLVFDVVIYCSVFCRYNHAITDKMSKMYEKRHKSMKKHEKKEIAKLSRLKPSNMIGLHRVWKKTNKQMQRHPKLQTTSTEPTNTKTNTNTKNIHPDNVNKAKYTSKHRSATTIATHHESIMSVQSSGYQGDSDVDHTPDHDHGHQLHKVALESGATTSKIAIATTNNETNKNNEHKVINTKANLSPIQLTEINSNINVSMNVNEKDCDDSGYESDAVLQTKHVAGTPGVDSIYDHDELSTQLRVGPATPQPTIDHDEPIQISSYPTINTDLDQSSSPSTQAPATSKKLGIHGQTLTLAKAPSALTTNRNTNLNARISTKQTLVATPISNNNSIVTSDENTVATATQTTDLHLGAQTSPTPASHNPHNPHTDTENDNEIYSSSPGSGGHTPNTIAITSKQVIVRITSPSGYCKRDDHDEVLVGIDKSRDRDVSSRGEESITITGAGGSVSTKDTSEESISSEARKKINDKISLVYAGLLRQFWLTSIACLFFIIDIIINTIFHSYDLLWLFSIQCIITVTVNFLSFRDSNVFIVQLINTIKRICIYCHCNENENDDDNYDDLGMCCSKQAGNLLDSICCISDLTANADADDSNSSRSSKSGKSSKSGRGHDESVTGREHTPLASVMAAVNHNYDLRATTKDKEDSLIRYSSGPSQEKVRHIYSYNYNSSKSGGNGDRSGNYRRSLRSKSKSKQTDTRDHDHDSRDYSGQSGRSMKSTLRLSLQLSNRSSFASSVQNSVHKNSNKNDKNDDNSIEIV